MSTVRDEEFRHFVQKRRAGLVRTATLLTAGDAHLAEDLVQTTLTRLYLAWGRVRRAENPDGYARRALANALIDETRRPWRRERSAAELPEPTVPSDAPSERVEALNEALRSLPPRMRAAVVFRYFHELSVAETADALGCSQGTVKSQSARAIDRLRVALSGHLDTTSDPTSDPTSDTGTDLTHRATEKEHERA